jgi:hypothetical protein
VQADAPLSDHGRLNCEPTPGHPLIVVKESAHHPAVFAGHK